MKFTSILMLHKVFFPLFIFCALTGRAQTAEQDSVSYDALFKWVERKLTYDYFDPTNQHWWVNRFQPNLNGSIVIKNIAAEHPKRVLEKVYHLRQFFLYDLNPNTISVIEAPVDQGRFVKGRIVRMEGFGDEKKIATKKDGVVGSDVSFIHISVPAFLEDSLQNYAFELQAKLKQLTYLSARLINANDVKKNSESIFSALRGNYVNQDSTAYLSFEVTNPGHVRYEWKEGERRWFGQIGYDTEKQVYFFIRSSEKGYFLRELTVDESATDLILKKDADTITFIGRNTLEFVIDGQRNLFYRF